VVVRNLVVEGGAHWPIYEASRSLIQFELRCETVRATTQAYGLWNEGTIFSSMIVSDKRHPRNIVLESLSMYDGPAIVHVRDRYPPGTRGKRRDEYLIRVGINFVDLMIPLYH